MLKEIKCDKFIEKTIKFSDGLNTVLGDDLSTNSIGKSTLLMIIDFVFGGNSFITKDSGTTKELGHLTFYFCFEFKNEITNYSRNTEFPELVQICDKDYNSVTEISISKFTSSLKDNYNLKENYISFRSVVSTFSRIWGKDNYNVDKPLQSYLKEPESTSVTNIIKLFNLYNTIVETETQIKEQEETNKTIKAIHKKNYVDKITKTEYKKNEFELDRIQNQITDIKENLLQYTMNIEELTSNEMIELKTEKSKILNLQSSNLNKIRRLELNLEQKSVKSKYFSKLSTYFENTNEDKIQEIESFHNKIGNILKRELNNAKKTIEEQNQILLKSKIKY